VTVPLRVTVAEAAVTPPEPGRTSALLMAHGTMQLRYYAPREVDLQTPHAQDELYVVATGEAEFVCGDARVPARPGDALLVPAGAVHRLRRSGPASRPGSSSTGRRAARPPDRRRRKEPSQLRFP
jgi:mannose-6-phosphate isomerase-like protein (cupin superfamily)